MKKNKIIKEENGNIIEDNVGKKINNLFEDINNKLEEEFFK